MFLEKGQEDKEDIFIETYLVAAKRYSITLSGSMQEAFAHTSSACDASIQVILSHVWTNLSHFWRAWQLTMFSNSLQQKYERFISFQRFFYLFFLTMGTHKWCELKILKAHQLQVGHCTFVYQAFCIFLCVCVCVCVEHRDRSLSGSVVSPSSAKQTHLLSEHAERNWFVPFSVQFSPALSMCRTRNYGASGETCGAEHSEASDRPSTFDFNWELSVVQKGLGPVSL